MKLEKKTSRFRIPALEKVLQENKASQTAKNLKGTACFVKTCVGLLTDSDKKISGEIAESIQKLRTYQNKKRDKLLKVKR